MIILRRCRHKFSIIFHHVLAPFKMPLSNMLRKIKFATQNLFANAALVPFLRRVIQFDVLTSSRYTFVKFVTCDTSYSPIRYVMEVLYHIIGPPSCCISCCWNCWFEVQFCKCILANFSYNLCFIHPNTIVLNQFLTAFKMFLTDMLSKIGFRFDHSTA